MGVSAGDSKLAKCLVDNFKQHGAAMTITSECKQEVLNVVQKAKGGQKAPTTKKMPQSIDPAIQMKCMSQVKAVCVGKKRNEISDCIKQHFQELSAECQAMASARNKGR